MQYLSHHYYNHLCDNKFTVREYHSILNDVLNFYNSLEKEMSFGLLEFKYNKYDPKIPRIKKYIYLNMIYMKNIYLNNIYLKNIGGIICRL